MISGQSDTAGPATDPEGLLWPAAPGRSWGRLRAGSALNIALLREDCGARRVVVFGSMVEGDGAYIDALADIGLAAWGIPEDDDFLAVARLALGRSGA